MKVVQKICRLCSCGDGILLDLFGPGKILYVKEINTCLSLEVKKGDGFPQNVCIKCVGQLEECSPYVSKVTENHQTGLDKRSLRCVCYYCHSKINYLFSITDSALKQTEACFNFQVPIQAKICHRCQFYLETLFELREKSRSALAQFCADDSLHKKVKEHREDSVVDIVDNLKRKFGPIMSQSRKRKKEEDVLEPRVQVMDVCAYMGITFFSKGSVNVKQFLQNMPSSPVLKRVRFLDKAIGQQQSPVVNKGILKNNLSSEGALSRKPGPKSSKNTKASQKLVKNICLNSPDNKSKKSSFMNDSSIITDSDEDSLPLKAVMDASVRKARSNRSLRTDFASPFSSSPHKNKEDNSKFNESLRMSPRTKKQEHNSEIKWNESNGSNKQKNTLSLNKMKKRPPVSAVAFKKSSPVSRNKRNLCDSGEYNEVDNRSSKRRRSRKEVNYAELLQEGLEHYSDPDDDFVKGVSQIDSDSGPDETPVGRLKSGRKPNRITSSAQKGKGYEPPEYLKALDKVLTNTPKSAFKPFICPTCHEGYVSTVKGMLHRLMAHDPRSNVSLKLSRVDERCEIPERHSQEPHEEEKEESLNASNENAVKDDTNSNPSEMPDKSNEACTIDAERQEKGSDIIDTGNPQQINLVDGHNCEVINILNFDKKIEHFEKQKSSGICLEENAVNNKVDHTSVSSEMRSDRPIENKEGEEDSDLMERPIENKEGEEFSDLMERPIEKKEGEEDSDLMERPIEKKEGEEDCDLMERPIENKEGEEYSDLMENSTQPTQEQTTKNEKELGMTEEIVPEKAADKLSTEAEGNASKEVEDDAQKEAEDTIAENEVENKEAEDDTAENEVENKERENTTIAEKEVINKQAQNTIAENEVEIKEAGDTISEKEVKNKEARDTIAEKEVENKETRDTIAGNEVENKEAEDTIAEEEGKIKEMENITAENEVENNETDIQLTKSDAALKESRKEDVEISGGIEGRVSENCTPTEEKESEFLVSKSPSHNIKKGVFSEREEKKTGEENPVISTRDILDSEGHPENTDLQADNVTEN